MILSARGNSAVLCTCDPRAPIKQCILEPLVLGKLSENEECTCTRQTFQNTMQDVFSPCRERTTSYIKSRNVRERENSKYNGLSSGYKRKKRATVLPKLPKAMEMKRPTKKKKEGTYWKDILYFTASSDSGKILPTYIGKQFLNFLKLVFYFFHYQKISWIHILCLFSSLNPLCFQKYYFINRIVYFVYFSSCPVHCWCRKMFYVGILYVSREKFVLHRGVTFLFFCLDKQFLFSWRTFFFLSLSKADCCYDLMDFIYVVKTLKHNIYNERQKNVMIIS